MSLILRDATINDLGILQHWDKQPHVIQSDPIATTGLGKSAMKVDNMDY